MPARINSLTLKKNQNILFSASRNLTQFNEFEPIGNLLNTSYTLFDKSNYMKLYQKDMIQVNYNHELVNGLYSNVDAQFISRESLLNNSFNLTSISHSIAIMKLKNSILLYIS